MKNTDQSWFTIEEIDDRIFAISEYAHWEHTHMYLFIGKTSAALVDTGTGIGNIQPIVAQLTDLPVLVITTHCHWDHIGGHRHFDNITIHADDRLWLEEGLPLPLAVVKADLMKMPFSRQPPADFSPDTYTVYTGTPQHILQDGDVIDLGQRTLSIIHTPGHSPGHICVYEAERGYLVTGDIVYEGTVYAHYPSTDPVALCQSIQRLSALPNVTRLLPGHHRLNISVATLDKYRDLCKAVTSRDMLRHGSGLHQGDGVALLF